MKLKMMLLLCKFYVVLMKFPCNLGLTVIQDYTGIFGCKQIGLVDSAVVSSNNNLHRGNQYVRKRGSKLERKKGMWKSHLEWEKGMWKSNLERKKGMSQSNLERKKEIWQKI